MGIRKFDKVVSNGTIGFVKGRMSTGYAILMDIDGNKLELKPIPKLKELKRITSRKSCLTSSVCIEQIDTALRYFQHVKTKIFSSKKEKTATARSL